MRSIIAAAIAGLLIVPALMPATSTGGDYYVTAPNGDRVRIETGPIAIPHGLDVTECAEEDGTGCVWIGAEDGNGVGLSFYTAPDGTIHYVTADRARALRGVHA